MRKVMSCNDSNIYNKSNRLERIAVEIVYNEYKQGVYKGLHLEPENYTKALDFLDLQLTFTEDIFNKMVQKALKILYGVKDE